MNTTEERRAKTLRRKAEARAEAPDPEPPAAPTGTKALLHELRVHQIELEMQNDELRRSVAELEASRERYFDLYDLAPVGYLTLSAQGIILETNLTAASLLGETRTALLRQPLSRFFLPEDMATYFERRRLLLERGEPQSCDLQLLTKAGAVSWVRLEMISVKGTKGALVIRATLSDSSARKLAERLLEQKTEGLEAALERLQSLVELLPVCSQCSRLRDDSGVWRDLDGHRAARAAAGAGSEICPDCLGGRSPGLVSGTRPGTSSGEPE